MEFVPEEVDGFALQDADEEEDKSCCYGRTHDPVDDIAILRLDGDTKEKETDGDFGAYHAHAVCWIAKVPPLVAISHMYLANS